MTTLFGLQEADLPSLKPTFHTSIPYAKHPQSDKIERYVLDFFSQLSIWPSEESKSRFLKSGTESIVVYYYPQDAKDHLIKPASVWFAFYFLFDDLCDADQAPTGLNLLSLVPLMRGDKKPEKGNSFEECVFEINERCRAACGDDSISLDLCRTMTETIVDWMKYNLALDKKMREQQDDASLGAFNTIDEFLVHRRAAFGGQVVFPCARWISNVQIPQEILEDSRIQKIEELCVSFGTLVNDLFSLRKELKGLFKKDMIDGNFACLNAVIWWAEKEKVSIRDAMEVIEKKVEKLESEFKVAVEEFMNEDNDSIFGRENSQVVKDYVKVIARFVAGNFGWHATCGRYNDLSLY